MNEETRAHRAWFACSPVGLVPVPQRSVEVEQGSVHRFDNFEQLLSSPKSPRLHVDTSAIAGLIEWYCNRLGMSVIKEIQSEKELILWFGYQDASQSAVVEFRSALKQSVPPKYYKPQPSSDVYWKIGLGLSLIDADTARSKLIRQRVEVTTPRQFRDIGYMCHLRGPFGFSLELLQLDFPSNFSSERVQASLKPNLALGRQANIGQITLRFSDINQSLQFTSLQQV